MDLDPQRLLLEGLAEPDTALRVLKINQALGLFESRTLPVDAEGNSILHHTIKYGYPDSLKLLAMAGVSPNSMNANNETPLHLIADMPDDESTASMADELLDCKASLRQPEDVRGETPLMKLCRNQKVYVLARMVHAQKIALGELVGMGALGSHHIKAIHGLQQDFLRAEMEGMVSEDPGEPPMEFMDDVEMDNNFEESNQSKSVVPKPVIALNTNRMQQPLQQLTFNPKKRQSF